jgi:hypothetical protein
LDISFSVLFSEMFLFLQAKAQNVEVFEEEGTRTGTLSGTGGQKGGMQCQLVQ